MRCEILFRIRKGDQINWQEDEGLLNKSLTLFDTLSYLQTQGLLRRRAKAWEYIASENQYFASNDSVCSYIGDVKSQSQRSQTSIFWQLRRR